MGRKMCHLLFSMHILISFPKVIYLEQIHSKQEGKKCQVLFALVEKSKKSCLLYANALALLTGFSAFGISAIVVEE